MDIGKKIGEVFEQMKERPMLMDKFYELEDMDQIYEFFHSVRGGYTKQEFFKYVSDFLDELDELDEFSNSEINAENLSNVAGGAGASKKALAGVLAAMSLFPAAPTGLYAAENSQNNTNIEAKAEEQPKASEENKTKEETKEENKEENQKKKSSIFSRIKKFIFKNKGKIALCVAGLVLAAIAIKNREGIINWTQETIDSIKKIFSPKKDVQLAGLEEKLKAGMSDEQAREEISKLIIGQAEEMKMPGPLSSAADFERYNAYLKVKEMRDHQIESLVSRYSKESQNVSWYSKIPYFCGLAGMLALGKEAAGGFSDCLKFFSSLQDSVYSLFGPYSIFSRFFNMSRVEYDPVKPVDSNSNLTKAFKEVKGQTKAKEQLRRAISQIVVERYSRFKNEKPYEKADVFYFIGPSGVGKTYMAAKLCEHKALTNDDAPYLFSAGDIDSSSDLSLVEQIFGPKNDYSYDNNKKTKSSLYTYIKNHPNGVVVFDEYDKLPDNSLDEVFRSAMDKGKVIVAGQELDCSGVTFILTSNESKESLNIAGGNKEREDDDSITHHTHDKSFTNRVHVVEFEKLFEDNYVDIAKIELYQKLNDTFKEKDMGGVKISMSEETIKKIADRTTKYGKGARYIKYDLLGEAIRVITELIFGNSGGKIKKFRGKTVELEYNLRDVSEEEAKYDAPADVEGKYYVKDGDKYKRWEFEAAIKD